MTLMKTDVVGTVAEQIIGDLWLDWESNDQPGLPRGPLIQNGATRVTSSDCCIRGTAFGT